MDGLESKVSLARGMENEAAGANYDQSSAFLICSAASDSACSGTVFLTSAPNLAVQVWLQIPLLNTFCFVSFLTRKTRKKISDYSGSVYAILGL